MTATSFDLPALRRRLDAIDDGVHDLLIERAEIVGQVADHKRSSDLAFYQPGREAEIVRRRAARHRGALPVASIVRIWREMLAASVSLETPFAVAVYAPRGSPGLWDLARDHYGSCMPISAYDSAGQVIDAVAGVSDSAGVLPMPRDGEPDPWWRHLLSPDPNTPRVVARLPFGPRGNARGGADALAIGHGAQPATGRDRTFVAIEIEEIGRARVLGLLRALGLDCTLYAGCVQPDRADALIELGGFVAPTDPRIEGFKAQLGTALHRLVPLGGYAVPLSVAVPAPPAMPGG